MEEFIAAVKQFPCLWNTKSKEYHDHIKKEDAWFQIVATLNDKEIRDIQTVKAEWKKLRDCHRDSLKRAKRRSGGVNNWKYTDSMDFLLPFMKTREKRRIFLTMPKFNSSSNTNSPSSITIKDENLSSEEEITGNLDNIHCNSSKSQKRKRKLDNVDDFVEVEIEDIYRREEKEDLRVLDNESDHTTTDKHALDSFFESMCATTKQFPTWLQNSVKRKIFRVVSEAEDTFEMASYSSPFITKVQSISP